MTPVLAHGLGDASVLPVPLPIVLVAAGALVLGYARWLQQRGRAPVKATPVTQTRTATTAGAAGGAPTVVRTRVQQVAPSGGWALPAWVTKAVDAPVTRMVLRALGLVGAAGVLVLLALGPAQADANPATRLVLVVVWAGLIPLSLIAPGAWRALSPLRGLSALLARATGDAAERPLPERAGWWPGVAALAAFAVVEGPLRGDPTMLLAFLVVYGLVQLAAAAVYGSGWYAHGEAFEVLAAVVGRLSPVRRGADGLLCLTSPRDRLAAPVPPGAEAVVGVLVGSAVADFVGDATTWNRLGLGTAGAIGLLLAAMAGCWALAAAAARPRVLAPAVVPLATAYLFTHYLAVLLIEGQAAFAQLAAVLRGANAANVSVNYEVLPGALAATVQLLGFLLPHLVAVTVGVGLASARYRRERVGAAVAPLVGVAALSAVGGLALRYLAG